jgi:RNA polymerase sigma factor (sigma-70 family)
MERPGRVAGDAGDEEPASLDPTKGLRLKRYGAIRLNIADYCNFQPALREYHHQAMKTNAHCAGVPPLSSVAAGCGRRVADYWHAVYGFLLRRGLGHHDAEDTTQSYYLKLIRCGLGERWEREAENEVHLKNLLFRGAANHCTDEYRRTQRMRRGGGEWHLSVEADDAAHQVPCRQPTPREAVEFCELKQQVNTAIGEMNQRHTARGRGTQFAAAAPHLLDEESGPSQQEAARSLNLRNGGFRALLFRLRRELAGELQRECAA